MIPAILSALGSASAGAGGAAELVGAAGAAKGLGDLGKNLGSLETVMTKLSPSMSKLVGAFNLLPNKVLEAEKALVTVTDTYVRALAAPIETVKALGDSVSRFVRLSNPAAASLFEFRVENSLASVGKMLEPILNALGRAADKTNEAMNKLAPAFEPLIDATVELTDMVGNDLVPAFRELAPVLKLSGELTRDLYAGMRAVTVVTERFTSGLSPLSGILGRLVGGFDEDAGKSVAARPARLSSIEDIQRRGAEASLMATAAAGKEAPKTTENYLKEILDFLKSLTTTEGWEKIGTKIADAIEKHLPNLPRIPGGPEDLGVKFGAILGYLRG